MVKNKSHVIFNEQGMINACRRSMKRHHPVHGTRYNVYPLNIASKHTSSFSVYDRKQDANFLVETCGHRWVIWEK